MILLQELVVSPRIMKQNLLAIGAGVAAFVIAFAATKGWNTQQAERDIRETEASQTADATPATTASGMVRLAGGEFTMGTNSDLG